MYDLETEISDLYQYKPELTRKKDFCSFWDKEISKLKKEPVKYKKTKIDHPIKAINVYEVTVYGCNEAPIRCLYVTPAEIKHKIPVLIRYHGYGTYTGFVFESLQWVIQGFAVIFAGVRGQEKESPDTSQYSTGSYTGWFTRGIESPYEYYYKSVYLDCLRIVDFVAVMEECDSNRILTDGGSQGGALSLATAAMDKRIFLALASYPAFGHIDYHLKMVRSIGMSHPFYDLFSYLRINDPKESGLENIKNTWSYFDIMNFAQDIECPVCIAQGLNDGLVPARSVFAVYNHINTEKEMHIYPSYGHEPLPFHEDEKIKFVAKYIE